jgi:hypothetical protein
LDASQADLATFKEAYHLQLVQPSMHRLGFVWITKTFLPTKAAKPLFVVKNSSLTGPWISQLLHLQLSLMICSAVKAMKELANRAVSSPFLVAGLLCSSSPLLVRSLGGNPMLTRFALDRCPRFFFGVSNQCFRIGNHAETTVQPRFMFLDLVGAWATFVFCVRIRGGRCPPI